MKIQELPNGTYTITLPKEIVRAKGWKKGDNLYIKLDNKGNIVLKKSEVNKVKKLNPNLAVAGTQLPSLDREEEHKIVSGEAGTSIGRR